MTEKIQNKILYRANNNEKSLGIRISNSTEEVIEIAGLMGLDYVYLDAQHSPFTLPEIEKYCRLSQGFGLTTMIRIPDGERTTILNYLDRGANVIQIPDLQTAKQAETFVKYTYFGPIGIRSSTSLRTVMQVQDASMDNRKNLYEFINKNTLIIPQLESITAFNNLDSILKVDGISFFAGGPEDIAQSMGLPGEPLNPKVTKAYAAACSKVRSSGKFMLEDFSDMIDANDIIIKETAELLKKHGRTPKWVT